MKNLYEILEVSENASDEIIEKAYKTLAKKYHPDLQSKAPQKENASKMMVEINNAYSVLSNKEKREEYDKKLEEQKSRKKIEEYNKILDSNEQKLREEAKEKVREEYEKYYRNYQSVPNNQVFYIKRRSNFKMFVILMAFIIIVYFVISLLLKIPFTRDFLMNIYNNNVGLKVVVDIFVGVINGIRTTLKSAWDFGRSI